MFYPLGVGFFTFRLMYQYYHFMTNAIVRMDLHNSGDTVTLTFKTGLTKTVPISKIHKAASERALVRTFEEAYLYPVDVALGETKSRYYFYGNG
jgi:hypothetical protein